MFCAKCRHLTLCAMCIAIQCWLIRNHMPEYVVNAYNEISSSKYIANDSATLLHNFLHHN